MLFTLKSEISFQSYEYIEVSSHSRYSASLLQRWVNKADYGNVYFENRAWLLQIHSLGIMQGFSMFKCYSGVKLIALTKVLEHLGLNAG